MPSIPSIVEGVISSPAPVLFVDTCSVIDIASGAKRLREHQDLRDALSICAGRATSPPKYHVIKASLIDKEYQDNIDSGVNELQSFMSKISGVIGRLNADGTLLGLCDTQPALNLDLPAKLEEVSNLLLSNSMMIDHHDDFHLAACKWAIRNLRPSKKGTFKDAQIMLEYLEVATALRSHGFELPIVFISSNTADFSVEKGSPNLHADIAGIFAGANLKFAHHWQMAFALLNQKTS